MRNIIEKLAYEAGKGKNQSERERRIYDVLVNVLPNRSEIRIRLNECSTPFIEVAHAHLDGWELQHLVWSELTGYVKESEQEYYEDTCKSVS